VFFIVRFKILTNETDKNSQPEQHFANRFWDASIFLTFLVLYSLAICIFLIITPFVLGLSALAGLIGDKKTASSWRAVSAP